jgi:hypothetical protein
LRSNIYLPCKVVFSPVILKKNLAEWQKLKAECPKTDVKRGISPHGAYLPPVSSLMQ